MLDFMVGVGSWGQEEGGSEYLRFLVGGSTVDVWEGMYGAFNEN